MIRQKKEESQISTGFTPLKGVKELYLTLKKERLPKFFLFVIILVVTGGALVFWAELNENRKEFTRLFDSFWWALVTITTVGYGDKAPITTMGRIVAILVMFMGVVVTSVLSGTVASIFVDRKIREGKGLQDINLRNHTVVCGWNINAESILDGLSYIYGSAKKEIVLVNEMDSEEFQALSVRHTNLDLRFVRGDFVHEKVLKRAALSSAKSAIILSDTSGKNTLVNADERTILATMAVKEINPAINTSAELIHMDNEQHLRRANVDEVLVNGEFNGFLLANATQSSGIPHLTKELLSFQSRSHILQQQIPAMFQGKSFSELLAHFLKTGVGVLIGFLSEEKKMSLDDILSEGSSAIDTFIKQKFAEAELDVFEQEGEELQIKLNPGSDYIIKDNDIAFVIGSA
ncbi:MAG TPA: potassium channel protein [bacterium]|nr:potassium channel protein [bacterium]